MCEICKIGLGFRVCDETVPYMAAEPWGDSASPSSPAPRDPCSGLLSSKNWTCGRREWCFTAYFGADSLYVACYSLLSPPPPPPKKKHTHTLLRMRFGPDRAIHNLSGTLWAVCSFVVFLHDTYVKKKHRIARRGPSSPCAQSSTTPPRPAPRSPTCRACPQGRGNSPAKPTGYVKTMPTHILRRINALSCASLFNCKAWVARQNGFAGALLH